MAYIIRHSNHDSSKAKDLKNALALREIWGGDIFWGKKERWIPRWAVRVLYFFYFDLL